MTLKGIDELFAADLQDPAYAAGYLDIALEEEGVEGFLYALRKVIRAQETRKAADTSALMPRQR